MPARTTLICVVALSFGLGVIAHAGTVRQPTPDKPRSATPRLSAPDSGVMRGVQPDVNYSYDPAKLAQNLQMLEQRVRELETHVHRYQDAEPMGSAVLTVGQIRGDNEALDGYQVVVINPGARTDQGSLRTKRTEGPTH